jgi:hypothetical protein
MHFSLRNLLLKTGLLFLIANFALALGDPLPAMGRLSLYNSVFPGRPRLPFGETPETAYNFSLYQLDAMFASHAVSQPKAADEFRVIVFGDSSVWGTLLRPAETLAGQLEALHLTANDKRVRVYNLGYPTMSLLKDLLILDWAMRYQPDLIIWSMTLESFPYDKQLFSPIIQNNLQPARTLIQKYNLSFDPNDSAFTQPTFWDRTLIGQRRALADVFRLQLYGVMWAATGLDQDYPTDYEPRANDLESDPSFHNLQPPHLQESDLAFEVLEAGVEAAGNIPILFVNEPMFIADGTNSDLRYNFFFPRWAYDDYRTLWNAHAEAQGWQHLDVWDLVPPGEFTNSAVHRTPAGEALLTRRVAEVLMEMVNSQ